MSRTKRMIEAMQEGGFDPLSPENQGPTDADYERYKNEELERWYEQELYEQEIERWEQELRLERIQREAYSEAIYNHIERVIQ